MKQLTPSQLKKKILTHKAIHIEHSLGRMLVSELNEEGILALVFSNPQILPIGIRHYTKEDIEDLSVSIDVRHYFECEGFDYGYDSHGDNCSVGLMATIEGWVRLSDEEKELARIEAERQKKAEAKAKAQAEKYNAKRRLEVAKQQERQQQNAIKLLAKAAKKNPAILEELNKAIEE